MTNSGKGYAGAISNTGTQMVKAPMMKPAKKTSGKVTKGGGKDLRTGK